MSAIENERTAEFDAFGPWVDEVEGPDGIPRLFRDFPIDFEGSRVVLKFPRNIARRDANPAMDLYDHLVIAGPERMTILSRRDAHYDRRDVAYSQLAVITESVNLLDGLLILGTVEGEEFTVPFNGSSKDAISGFVDLLRELAAPHVEHRPPVLYPVLELDDLGKPDAIFVTSYREIKRRDPSLRLLGAHGRRVLMTRGGTASWIAHVLWPMTLHGGLLSASATELQILSRREWLVRRSAPVVSLSRTIVIRARLSRVSKREHPDYIGADIVTLTSGASVLEIVVPSGSDVEKALLRVDSTNTF
jgi:hypothetical protein